jgi:WD40 repeat protein
MTSERFSYDLFLSHSSADKAIVRPLAERLRGDGLTVWFDEWVIKPGDSIPAKIEDGLERSRVLVLCMSAHAFGSGWAQLESGTFRFRDPLNKERRFIPLRLDDAEIKGSLAQFLYIDWRPAESEQEYTKLVEACRPTATEKEPAGKLSAERVIQLDYKNEHIYAYAFSSDGKRALTGGDDHTVRLWDMETGICLRVFKGHTYPVYSVAWSPDGKHALSGADDNTVRLWDIESGFFLRVFEGHTDMVWSVAWSSDGKLALSGASDNTVLLWDIESGHCLRVFEGHTGSVLAVAWHPDSNLALTGATDQTIRLWDIESGDCLRVFKGHMDWVRSVSCSRDGNLVLSGGRDNTVRLWDIESGHCLRVFEGHTDWVWSVVWSPDNRYALSAAADKTIRLWNIESGGCLRLFKGHTASIKTAVWNTCNHRLFSGDEKGGIRIWDLSEFVTDARSSKVVVPATSLAPEQVQYTNAKVLLVGESGAGKTGLSNYLAHGITVEAHKPLPSTDGAWATHWPLKHGKKSDGVEREIWLWDFAGQVDYRLVHQLHMEDAAVAVVFDPQKDKDNLFEGLGRWDQDIQKATRNALAKLLVAGRVDRGGLVVSADSIKKFMKEHSYLGSLLETSAMTGQGCDQLRDAIVKAIDWKSIPETTSPALYHRLKQEILNLRDRGFVLIRLSELKQRMEITLHSENFELAELNAVISLLAGPGMIQRLDFGGFILLRPEILSRYAAAVVRKVRKHPQELGCIREDELLAGKLDYQDFKRLENQEDENVVLRALLELFISRAWCLRQPYNHTAMLTFPSYFRRERTEQPSHPSVLVSYRFDGPADDIYATLVVLLHHTVAFESIDLWNSAADFRTQTGQKLGFTMMRESSGSPRLEVYFEPDVDQTSQVLFLRYVHDHLMQHAQNVVRLRRYYCINQKCQRRNQPFADQSAIDEAIAPGGKGKVFCPSCGKPISLLDAIEEKFESPEVKAQSRKKGEEAQAVIDNESRELLAVHHTGFIVAEAGQIFRPTPNSDWGIDGEIEFKNDQGRACGKRLYVQLKSGDSYLKKRRSDGAEVFQIKNPHWADYWQQHEYTVMLVIRTSDGEIRWMDVTTYLKRKSSGGKKVKQIIFDGERLDVMSVRRWRDRVLDERGS